MFSPEMIAGMLGIQPEQIEHMKAVIPQIMQAAYDSNQRLIRLESEMIQQRQVLNAIAGALGDLAGAQRAMVRAVGESDDDAAPVPMPAALIGGH